MTIGGGYTLEVASYSGRIQGYVLGTDSNGNYGWHTIDYNGTFTNVSFVVFYGTIYADVLTDNVLHLYEGTVIQRTTLNNYLNKLMYLTGNLVLDSALD